MGSRGWHTLQEGLGVNPLSGKTNARAARMPCAVSSLLDHYQDPRRRSSEPTVISQAESHRCH